MYNIKRIAVHRRIIVNDVREKLEQYLTKKYHAAKCTISNGIAHIEWFAGQYDDTKDVNMFVVLLRSTFTIKKSLPSNWMEVASHWIIQCIDIEQVEELLGMDFIEIPQEFFDYASKLENDYEDWCSEQYLNTNYYGY